MPAGLSSWAVKTAFYHTHFVLWAPAACFSFLVPGFCLKIHQPFDFQEYCYLENNAAMYFKDYL